MHLIKGFKLEIYFANGRAILIAFKKKLELISRSLVHSLWRGRHVRWSYLPSRGASGGVLVLFDKRVVEREQKCVGDFIVACSFKNLEDGFLLGFYQSLWP